MKLVPGRFYKARNGEIWCCYALDGDAPEHCRAWCIWVPSRGRPRVEYFYEDGRYDTEGKREHCLVQEVEAHTIALVRGAR